MANLATKKRDTALRLVELIPRAMKIAADIKELKQYATDCGFLAAGANAMVDADFVEPTAGDGGPTGHLTAATFNDAVTAIDSLTLSTANATKLRVASRTPIPGG